MRKYNFLKRFLFLAATGLKCYECPLLAKSMEDCVKNQKEQNCTGFTEPRCVTYMAEYKQFKAYEKSCTTKADCDLTGSVALKACKAAGGKCEYKCCDKDLCNKGTSPMVSILLMVSCATVGFFRFF